MKSTEMVLLRKEVIGNCDECVQNADWNGMLHDSEKMRLQPEDMISWLPTVRLPDNTEDPYCFEPMVLLA